MTDDNRAFIASIAAAPDDPLPPLVYADWMDDRGDPRGPLLRVWADLAWRASHAGSGFRALLAEYRRLWHAADPDWRSAFGAARPWVSAQLAEELCRGYFRYVKQPFIRGEVIPGQANWFTEPGEPDSRGWLVRYWADYRSFGDRRPQRLRWMLFVQADLGWVYTIAARGPRFELQQFDVIAGEGRAF
ncbi:hypothetical protein VT84_23980 [Gemmata sp. SH-PL17]|uniref:TIGR02996 domain-containing protein n=1 Tax=Gemmata sp. SH-PL17 TaxID=1630693 RepID=UPI0004AFF13B|nr:TIGR02996 domain-containing protein [Gemmata sp. SH-PL17]AMV27481.1 hypothetical protein VT84_23980 [Gemmata sp. SH-PL17]